MSSFRFVSGPGGDGFWGECGDTTSNGDNTRRGTRRRKTRGEPYMQLSAEARLSQQRIRRESERQRSLHMACTLMSVTSLTPGCGPQMLLTKYQRLSQLVRYTAFLEDATSALVKELGVRLNFDFAPVTRYIRRLRYQQQFGGAMVEVPEEEVDEVKKLLETMSASEPHSSSGGGGGGGGTWRHRNAPAPSRLALDAAPAPAGAGRPVLSVPSRPHDAAGPVLSSALELGSKDGTQ